MNRNEINERKCEMSERFDSREIQGNGKIFLIREFLHGDVYSFNCKLKFTVENRNSA